MSYNNNEFSSADRSASDPSANTNAFTPSFNQNRDAEFGSSNRRYDDVPVGSGNYNRDDKFNRGGESNRSNEFSDSARQREFERQGANYSASGVDSSGSLGSTGVPGDTTTAETIGITSENRSGSGYGTGERDRDYDYQHSAETQPGLGDRMMGSMEKAAGKMTGNRERVEHGEERMTGGNTDKY